MNKFINVVVFILVSLGTVAVFNHLTNNLQMRPADIVLNILKYISLPLGIAFKIVQWYVHQKKEILEELKETKKLANENRSIYESISYKMNSFTESNEVSWSRIYQEMQDVDKRVVVIEQTASLNSRLLSQQQQLIELNDRLNQIVLEIQKDK